MPPDSNERSVAVLLALLHGADVVGRGSSLRNRTTRSILRVVRIQNLLVRNADALRGNTL